MTQPVRRRQRKNTAALGRAAGSAGLSPLDRAADRRDLLARRRVSGEERVERRGELAARHLRGLLPAVVDATVVRELPVAVEDVDVRRADGSEGARDVLR